MPFLSFNGTLKMLTIEFFLTFFCTFTQVPYLKINKNQSVGNEAKRTPERVGMFPSLLNSQT